MTLLLYLSLGALGYFEIMMKEGSDSDSDKVDIGEQFYLDFRESIN